MLSPIQTWIAALGTIAVFSLVLYKDNKLFRLTEGLLIGVSAAHSIVLTYHNFVKPRVTVDIARDGNYALILAIVLGALIYVRFLPPVAWLSRIPVAFWLGVGSAYVIGRQPGVLITQIQASFLRLDSANNVVFVFGLLASTAYFVFTVQSGSAAYGVVTRAGKLFLLVAFGASFANTVMARMSTLLGRVQFLLQDWLKITL
jgi:hypothetical protein